MLFRVDNYFHEMESESQPRNLCITDCCSSSDLCSLSNDFLFQWCARFTRKLCDTDIFILHCDTRPYAQGDSEANGVQVNNKDLSLQRLRAPYSDTL